MKLGIVKALILLTVVPAAAQRPPRAVQQVPAREDTVLRIEALRVRALLSDDITLTPGAAAVLTREGIARFRPFTLHDALGHVAGVRTIDDDLLGRRSGIGIRGAPPRRSRKTLLLEDGSPINSSTYLDPSAHYTPPLERLERVEVLKGAGQIVHGPLNNHGIINFRNRRAGSTPHTTLELGSGALHTFRRHALHSRTVGAAGVVLSYTGLNTDGVFDVEEHQFDDFFGSASFALTATQRLETSFTLFRERSVGYDEANLSPQQFALHPRSKRRLDEGREFNNFSVNYLKADLVHDARVAQGVHIATRVFATRLDRPRLQTRGVAPAAGGVMEGRDRLYRTAGADTRLELADLNLLGATQTVQAGLRHERHYFDYARPVGRPGEVLNERQRGSTFAVAGVDGYTRDGRLVTYQAEAYSGFLQTSLALGAWLVTPGVRAESYTQSRHVVYWPGSDDDGARHRDRHTLLLPGLSVLYRAAAARQLYAGVHRGFAPATARSEEFPLIPETGINSQLGIRSAGGRVGYDVALFYNRIHNTLIRDDVDRFGEALFVNTANSRVHGLDAALQLNSDRDAATLNVVGEIAWNLTRARFVGGPLHGNRVPEVPLQAGSLTLGLERHGAWRWSVTAGYMGGFYSDKENTEELREDAGWVPDHTVFSGRADYTIRRAPHTALWVQGRNLADHLYISDVQDGLRPGAPRTLSAGVTVIF